LGWNAIALLVLVLTGWACFGGNPPERTYFALQYPMGEQVKRYQEPRHPVFIRVQRFDTALAYNRQEIVYRKDPHSFRYYAYRLWAAKPPKLLGEVITNHLRLSNLAEEVTQDIGDKAPDYELRAVVLALEEMNASETEWFAHVSIRLSLSRYKDNAQIWEYTFDERRPVYVRQPVHVVRTISEILEEQTNEVVRQLDVVLSKELNVAPPEDADKPFAKPTLAPTKDPVEPKATPKPEDIPKPEDTPVETKPQPKAKLRGR